MQFKRIEVYETERKTYSIEFSNCTITIIKEPDSLATEPMNSINKIFLIVITPR